MRASKQVGGGRGLVLRGAAERRARQTVAVPAVVEELQALSSGGRCPRPVLGRQLAQRLGLQAKGRCQRRGAAMLAGDLCATGWQRAQQAGPT